MNPNLKELVELSDCEWIQYRWSKFNYIFFYDKIHSQFLSEFQIKDFPYEIWGCKENYIWLPVGFNPKTGNLQIDDLLMEILKVKGKSLLTNEKVTFNETNNSLRTRFFDWWEIKVNKWTDPTKWYYSDIILKLMWLKELIEEKSDVCR